MTSDFEKARALLREAGYDGTPIVLLHSTDLQVLTNLAPVAKAQMERAGFKVDELRGVGLAQQVAVRDGIAARDHAG